MLGPSGQVSKIVELVVLVDVNMPDILHYVLF